jgi:hypothetical protein
MKAITLWRPWEQAIVHGSKRIENRPWALWPHMIGKPIAVHAGKRYDIEAAESMRLSKLYDPPHPDDSPLGIVGVMVVGSVVDESDPRADRNVIDNPWFNGPYGWVLTEVAALDEPIPARGMQGLWTLPHDVERRVLEQLPRFKER